MFFLQRRRQFVFAVQLLLLLGLLLLLLLCPAAHNLSASPSSSAAIPALRQLIYEFYAPNTQSLAISAHANERRAIWRMRDTLGQLLLNFDLLKVTIEMDQRRSGTNGSESDDNMLDDMMRKFNLLLVDGPEALEFLHPAVLTRDYDINEHYLVLLLLPPATTTASTNGIVAQLFEYFWQHYIINVSLLLEAADGAIDLFTFFPFASDEQCKRATVASINRFAHGRWLHADKEHVFPSKMLDLQHCPLLVAVWDTPPYLSLRPNQTGLTRVGDFEGRLLVELANKLKFSLDLVVPPNDEQRGKRLPNGTTTGAMYMLEQRLADLSLGSFRYTLERSELLTGALPYYQTWQTYGVLLTAQSYTSLEILTFAFDNNTWRCLGLSVSVVAMITLLLQRRRCCSGIAQLILGHPAPRTPLTNVIASFLGYPVEKLPRNIFSRFVLTLWILFGNLLRIAYQSLLFKLLQTNLYREPPHSLTELIDNGYTLVMTAGTKDSVYTVPRIDRGQIQLIVNQNSSELSTFVYMEVQPKQLLAGVSPQDFFTYYVIKYNRRGVFYILPEKIFTQHITMYFTKHSFLIERFNQIFMQLRSQGMIDYWASQSLDTSFFRSDESVKIEAITLGRISGVFVLYAMLTAVAGGVLCMELAWHRWQVQRLMRKRYIKDAFVYTN